MLYSHFTTAVRNLLRNRLYSFVGIFGLAVGLCAAITAGLILRNQLNYDRFIEGYESTYTAVSMLIPDGRTPSYAPASHSSIASLLTLRFPEITTATRLVTQSIVIRGGNIEAKEDIYWADPNVFDVLPLPVHAGSLRTALRQPDTIVLTRSAARKYFGREDPIGETLQLARQHVVTVTAVIEDLPANSTQLRTGIFASGASADSELKRLDSDPANATGGESFGISAYTFFRLAPDAGIERLQARMPELMNSIWPRRPPGLDASMQLIRIDKVHLFPGLNPGIRGRIAATVIIGTLILLIACVNFVNLATARSVRRATEVGIRKAAGATRTALIVQFLGESLLHVVVAATIALALTEWSIPHVNAFLDTGVTFRYWQDAPLAASITLGVIVLAILAGFYPAFVVAAFRPAVVLKGTFIRPAAGGKGWQTLVVVQFAILIGLMVATGVVYQQLHYATHNALRIDTDQVMIIETPCTGAFHDELQRLRGVRGLSCSGRSFLGTPPFDNIALKDGNGLAVSLMVVDAGLLEMYGLEPLAGRFFRASSETGASTESATGSQTQRLVLNAAAVRALGYDSASAALGQPIKLSNGSGEIIGVVADFSLEAVTQRINPTLYLYDPQSFEFINVKLTGRELPETLTAIDRLWLQTGATEPIKRYFVNEHIESLYRDVLREAQMFAALSVVAVLLAALGLFALTASVTERRTKEIGIRKAMGANTTDVLRLLLWQFTKPVLWANLISWPITAYLMTRWLQGFAYHVELSPWLFVYATLVAMLIAQLTVAAHCYIVARRQPVAALRFE